MLANGVLVRSDDASEGHSRSEQALHRLEPRLDYHRGERAPRAGAPRGGAGVRGGCAGFPIGPLSCSWTTELLLLISH